MSGRITSSGGDVSMIDNRCRHGVTRREALLSLAGILTGSPLIGLAQARSTWVYVGTYTGPKSKGIYLFRLQTESQNPALVAPALAAETPSPSFLELDLKRRLLFAVNGVD